MNIWGGTTLDGQLKLKTENNSKTGWSLQYYCIRSDSSKLFSSPFSNLLFLFGTFFDLIVPKTFPLS